MLNRNARYHEWLLPYLEGRLDEARRAQIEARLAADPDLAAEAERLRRTLNGLRGAAARTPRPEKAKVPADLWPHLRARLVLEPTPRPRPQPRAWWLAAPAAAALIVATFWLPGWHTPTLPEISPKPPARQNATPVPQPVRLAVPMPPERVAPAPANPLQAAKLKTSVTKPPPTQVAAHPDPFALPVPPAPVPKSAQSGVTPPMVSTPANKPSILANNPVPAAPVAHADAVTNERRAASLAKIAVPAPPPLLPLPAPAAQNEVSAGLGGAGGFGGGGMGPITGGVPKETVNGLGAARQPSSPPLNSVGQSQSMAVRPAAPPLHGTPQTKMGLRAAPKAPDNAPQAFAAVPQAGLDAWQASLSAAVQPPLWGENEGEQQANQALMAAREVGMLDDLRARLELRRAQAPQDVVAGRMLAAVLEFGFSAEAALHERRRVSGLEGATGEDWFRLAQAEEKAGNGQAARAAYRHALESPVPPSSFHAAIARGRS